MLIAHPHFQRRFWLPPIHGQQTHKAQGLGPQPRATLGRTTPICLGEYSPSLFRGPKAAALPEPQNFGHISYSPQMFAADEISHHSGS